MNKNNYNILFCNDYEINNTEPSFFKNLNLNTLLKYIEVSEYDKEILKYYYTPLKTIDDIKYRQDVFIELDNHDTYLYFYRFFSKILALYKVYNEIHMKIEYTDRRRLLKILDEYINILIDAKNFFSSFKTDCFKGFYKFLSDIVEDKEFIEMNETFKKLKKALSTIEYSIIFRGTEIYVDKKRDDKPLNKEFIEAFSFFQYGDNSDYIKSDKIDSSMFVDEKIFLGLSKIYKTEFTFFSKFAETYKNFFDKDLYKIAIDSRFYISYKLFINKLIKTGLAFSYPTFIPDYNEKSTDSFDVVLAYNLYLKGKNVVVNSYELEDNERIIIISGPNQGGKTTFARSVAINHYLASLGFAVSGSYNRLHLIDDIFTHFKTEENIENLNGKLQSELEILKDIFDKATKDSFIILNEIFASTTATDGYMLGKKILEKIEKLGCFSIFVTFLNELVDASSITTSMISNVKDDSLERTYKITKAKSDGKSYVKILATKHNLTYDEIIWRLKNEDRIAK